ncbi:MAG: AsmA family protein [Geminicoccaceae bacterium]
MRSLLITVVIALGVVAGAAVAVTLLVDPDALRDRLVGELQDGLGQPVVVRGGADLVLLPSPMLTVSRVSVGDPAAAAGTAYVEIDRVDLAIAPASLLAERLEIASARLVRPTVRLHTVPELAPLADMLLATGDLQRLTVIDGRILPPAGDTAILDTIEADLGRAEDRSLSGSVRTVWDGHPLALAIDSGAFAAGRATAVKLRLGLGELLAATFDGNVRPDPQAPTLSGRLGVDVPELGGLREPLAALTGRTPWAADAVPGAVRLDGSLAYEAGRWSLADSTLAVGGNSVGLAGSWVAAAAQLDADVEAETFDPENPALVVLAELAAPGLAAPGLTGRLKARLENLPWHGGTLRDLRLDAGFDGRGGLAVERLAARLPGEGEAEFAGTVTGLPPLASASGRLTLSTAELPALLPMLDLPAPAAPDRLRSLNGTAAVDLTAGGITLRELDLQLDATRIAGSLAVARGVRPQLAAVLQLDRLTLDGYLPATADLPGRLAELGRAADIALNLSFGSLGWQAVRAEGVRLRGEVVSGRLTVDELAVDDLGEATARLSGTADLASGDADLRLDATAARPARLARLLDLEPPAVLGRFAPLEIRANLARSGGSGTLSGDIVAAGLSVRAEATLPADLGAMPETVNLKATAPALAELLGQLGLPGKSGPAFAGPAGLDIALRRADDGALTIDGAVELGPSRAGVDLVWSAAGTRPRLAGTIEAAALEPALVDAAYEMAELALDLPAGPLARWPARWPEARLPLEILQAADLDLRFRRSASDVLAMRLADGALSLEATALPVLGGTVTGTLDLRAAPATLSVRGSTQAISAGLVLDALGVPQERAGQLDLELHATAAGDTIEALVGSLAGSGRFTLRDGILDGIRLEPGEAVLETPVTAVRSLGGPYAIDRGLVAAPGLALELASSRATVDASLDLPAWLLDATVRPASGEAVRLVGPPGEVRNLGPVP